MDSQESHHSHLPTMVTVFLCLLGLTVITVSARFLVFGADWVNIVIAMTIASGKAGLVATYFMHLRWENSLTRAFAFLSLPLLVLLIGFDLWDVAIRYLQKLYIF